MVYYGDQSNTTFLSHFLERSGGNFDVIIDDGSHLPSHQVISFEALWKSVVPGGQYIVEDIETSYYSPATNVNGISGYSLADVRRTR